MKPMSTLRIAALVLTAAVCAADARAGELYLTGNLGISNTSASTSGNTDFFELSGSDSDASPVYGGAFGYGFRLNEPIDRILDVRVPSWELRSEVAVEGGRSFEFRTDGGDGFFTEVDSWAVLYNTWIEFPLHEPASWIFGRVPFLQPLSLYAGAGLGTANLDVKTTDNFSKGADDGFQFAWQAGAGLSYAFTDRVSLSLGYRYHDLGDVSLSLQTAPDVDPFGKMKVDLTTHEFTTALRVNFWSLDMPSWAR